MRCIIYANSEVPSWLKECFPALDPYLLKIVNKTLLEYFLDLASMLKVTDLRIVSDVSIKEYELCFKDGAKWGLNLSYALAKPGDGIKTVILKNSSFCREHNLFIVNGFFFVHYKRNLIDQAFDYEQEFCISGDSNRLRYLTKGDHWDIDGDSVPKRSCFSICELRNVIDYYDLSMNILSSQNQDYVLPGYSNQKDTFLGLNLIYPNSAQLNPPIMIGNNNSFHKYTNIGPNAIIGNNVIVDENTVVTNSIILDNTYIGAELEIERKVVYKNCLIDINTGKSIIVQDKVLISHVERGIMVSMLNRFIQLIIAATLIVLQLIPWLLLYTPYSLLSSGLSKNFIRSKSYALIVCDDPRKLATTWFGRLLVHLSLDKFILLLHVFTRKLYLVGNSLLANEASNRKIVNDLPVYKPGVFSLAENVQIHSEEEQYFYELEYINNVSTRLCIKIILHSLIHRLTHKMPQN